MRNFNFQDYFNETIIKTQRLDMGLTNHNYLIVTEKAEYFFRLPDKDVDHLFDRKLEKSICEHVKPLEIDIPYNFFDEETGIKISPYIPNLLTFENCNLKDKFTIVANLIKKLHGLNFQTKVIFNVEEKVKQYQANTKNFIFDLKPYASLLEFYHNYQAPMTLCHNDLVDGNLVFSQNQGYIIDYEYACDNYPIFDITSFITENDIIDPSLKKAFYQDYYQKPIDEKLAIEIANFEKIHHYLWCHWAMMMLDIKKDNCYYDIALNKYQQLLK